MKYDKLKPVKTHHRVSKIQTIDCQRVGNIAKNRIFAPKWADGCEYRKHRGRKPINNLTGITDPLRRPTGDSSWPPETHPDPPCREGGKDKGCLRKPEQKGQETHFHPLYRKIGKSLFVLASLPTGRVGVGLWGPGWVSCGASG